MQINNSYVVNTNGKQNSSKVLFGFRLDKEQAEIFTVLSQKAPKYKAWVSNGIASNLGNNAVDSLLRDSYQCMGLSKGCRIIAKENPERSSYFDNLALAYRFKAYMLKKDSKIRAAFQRRATKLEGLGIKINTPVPAGAMYVFG